MSEQTITVDVPVKEEFIKDIMVTMVESGYDSLFYWGAPTFINRGLDGMPVLIALVEDDDEKRTHHVLTRDMVVPAIQRIIKERLIGSALMEYLVRGVLEQDAGDIDATLADCILQVAVLGEVRYG
jgi:hypothetical protein